MTKTRTGPRGGSILRAGGAALALLAALAACQRAPARMEIDQVRIASKPTTRVMGASSAQRFGGSSMGAATGGGPMGADPGGAAGLAFDAPAGWEPLPTSSLRPVNLRPAGNPDAECYVTLLAGDGGGLIANVDRWRKQLGLEPMTPAEVDALADVELLGGTGKLVELEGAYSGMGDEARAGWKLLGAVALRPGSAVFVKMTGPAEVVDAEREGFLAFCASLREGGAGGAAAAAPNASSGGEATQAASGPLAWAAPQGWVEAPPKPMRLVGFQVGAESECYISLLGGEGGGLVANLDRWRRELGLDATTPEEVAAMPRLEMLGHEAILFEGVGTFSSMGGAPREGVAVLGAVCLRGADAVFVKFLGPQEEVLGRREEFTQFLRSLKEVAR